MNGQIDPSFGDHGRVMLPATTIHTAFVESDGSIVTYQSRGSTRLLVRYTKTGQPDTTFGVNGYAVGPQDIDTDNPIHVMQIADTNTTYWWNSNSTGELGLWRYTQKSVVFRHSSLPIIGRQ